MKHKIKHDLSMELAKKATSKAFESYAERFSKYNPTANWTSEHEAEVGFEAKGVKLGGSIALSEGAVELDMSVPLLFRPFQSKAVDIIEGEIRDWIDKAARGDLDD